MAIEKSSAPHAHPSTEEQDDTVEAHYACLQRIAMTLTRMHANVMPCTVGTPFYGS